MSKKFATLRDVAGSSHGGDSGGEHSDGDEQPFYVGGSEHSGQQVVGPPKSRKNGDEVADELFRAAREAGAEVDESSPGGAQQAVIFSGGGHRLGDDVRGTARVEASPTAQSSSVSISMTVYTNGFTLNDGELRSFHDAANATFLDDVSRGRIPRELSILYPGRLIDLKMSKKSEKYEAPKIPRVPAFAGSGERLGAIVPEVVANAPIVSKEEAATAAKSAQDAIMVDPSKPVTQIQVRLPDGNRLIVKLNQTSTVNDLRAFIAAASPSLSYSPFELRTSFPNAVITDEWQSLQEASLLNSVVIVKIT